MSHISASRMPHAYAKPDAETDQKAGGGAKRDVAPVHGAIRSVSRGSWMIGALGVGAVGAVGAALYATLRAKPAASKKRGQGSRKSAARRGKAAA